MNWSRIFTLGLADLFAAIIAFSWVWLFAWLLNPDIDSGTVWFIGALLWMWTGQKIKHQLRQEGLL